MAAFGRRPVMESSRPPTNLRGSGIRARFVALFGFELRASRLFISVLPVFDGKYENNRFLSFYRIEQPVFSQSESVNIFVFAFELFNVCTEERIVS